eukprot:CAMPEP_0174719682 /NCGR_PEP_ID=MMETSP1094-20130205/31716_1 /TAXON_ID=156173 /ORGANISM="Chrysochromulina brevifilum, Strain UTEX LB 985" /LENGTH=51 /DNA_ID=CAMNT_0015920027 /DNA_START=48 /DNA_END=203 /DNA_ORIENTATION=+
MDSTKEAGGEARWLKRRDVGSGGYLQGWAKRAVALRKQVRSQTKRGSAAAL